MLGDEVQVRHRCQVSFAIGDDYKEKVGFDVVPLVVGIVEVWLWARSGWTSKSSPSRSGPKPHFYRDALLGRLWICDKNGVHRMRDHM